VENFGIAGVSSIQLDAGQSLSGFIDEVDIRVGVSGDEDGGGDPGIDDVLGGSNIITSIVVFPDPGAGDFQRIVVSVLPCAQDSAARDGVIFVSGDVVLVDKHLESQGVPAVQLDSGDGDLGSDDGWDEFVGDMCVAVGVGIEDLAAVVIEPGIVVSGVHHLELLDPLIRVGTALGCDAHPRL